MKFPDEIDFIGSLFKTQKTTDVRMVIRQNDYPYDEIAILYSLLLTTRP